MKIFLCLTLIVLTQVNGRICNSTNDVSERQFPVQMCLPDFRFSIDWWAQLGVDQFYIFINSNEFISDEYSCLDEWIEAHKKFGHWTIWAIFLNTLSQAESNLKARFCDLGERHFPDLQPSKKLDDCEKCTYAMNIVEKAPKEFILQMNRQIIHDLQDKDFCGNHLWFETVAKMTECDDFVDKLVPNITKWFQGYIQNLGSSKACQYLSFCSSIG